VNIREKVGYLTSFDSFIVVNISNNPLTGPTFRLRLCDPYLSLARTSRTLEPPASGNKAYRISISKDSDLKGIKAASGCRAAKRFCLVARSSYYLVASTDIFNLSNHCVNIGSSISLIPTHSEWLILKEGCYFVSLVTMTCADRMHARVRISLGLSEA